MSAQTWYAISLVGYFVAAIGLIATIIIYIKLDILDVIGDLTGRTVAREIKNMQDNRGAKSSKKAPGMNRYNKTGTGSRNAKSAKSSRKYTSGKSAAVTSGGGNVQVASSASVRRKAKNGTAEMGIADAAPDKRVLHSKTDKLSRETEELYEDFDPRVEYSRPENTRGGTALLKPETGVLKPGTELLPETEPEASPKSVRRGTEVLQERGTMLLQEGMVLLEEEAVEPVKFSVTRSYLVVHSEESIL